MWDTDGEPEPGSGGGFLLLSTFLLVALMSYQILLVWGQPRPAQLSDPVYIEPQERSVSVSGFS